MIRAFLKRESKQDRTLRLLDAERDALVDGPMDALQALVAKREALMAEILSDEAAPAEPFLRALKEKAERNSRLLRASLSGLRVAREQVSQAEHLSRSLRTYTADGASVEVSPARHDRDERR
jgi:hypothetical protein